MTPGIQPFTTTRELAAPRALVYRVFTEPEHLLHWMGAEGFRSIHSAMDFRVGGTHHYGLEGPGGHQMWGKQVFREIEPERRTVHIQSFSDCEGGLARHPLAPTWPLEMLAATDFEDAGPDRTRVTITWLPHDADAAALATFDGARAGMEQGFAGMWSKLEAYLATLQRR